MKKAKLTAFCGMVTALSVVLMAITTILPVLMYVLPLVTGVAVLIVSEVSNKRWGAGVYLATSLVSLVLLTDKETALAYALFFGYYPLIRNALEGLPKLLRYMLKLVVFNAAAVMIGAVGVFVLGLPADEYSEFGKATIPILLGLANLVFVLYDAIFSKWNVVFIAISQKIKRNLR